MVSPQRCSRSRSDDPRVASGGNALRWRRGPLIRSPAKSRSPEEHGRIARRRATRAPRCLCPMVNSCSLPLSRAEDRGVATASLRWLPSWRHAQCGCPPSLVARPEATSARPLGFQWMPSPSQWLSSPATFAPHAAYAAYGAYRAYAACIASRRLCAWSHGRSEPDRSHKPRKPRKPHKPHKPRAACQAPRPGCGVVSRARRCPRATPNSAPWWDILLPIGARMFAASGQHCGTIRKPCEGTHTG